MADNFPPEQKLLQTFHLLINSVRLHQDNNKVLMSAVDQFIALICQLCHEEDEVTLLFSEGNFYLNQEKIVTDRLASSFANQMIKYFEDRNFEGLRFYETLEQAPFHEITTFFRYLNDADKQDDTSSWLEQKIEENNFSWVEHVRVSQVSVTQSQGAGMSGTGPSVPNNGKGKNEQAASSQASSDGSGTGSEIADAAAELKKQRRKSAIQTYGNAVLSLQDVAQKISTNKRPSIKKTMRLVQNMVDMVVDDNQMFLSLSTIRDYDDYTYTHSINVAILSICMGHKLQLSKSSLETLSLGALFHDLGKIDVPKEILNKPGRLDAGELQQMQKHALDSVRRIIKLKTTRKKKASLILPPFEHHLKYDLSGYPKTPRKKSLSLFGRIICIADVFDAVTAPRIYRPTAWSPDQALGFMLERSGTDFDPVLLKVFINMIGIYPVGTLLMLDDDEMGLVASYSEDEEQKKELQVQLLLSEDDGTFGKGELINMGAWNPESASFNRPVLESLHPSVYGIQPAEFIM